MARIRRTDERVERSLHALQRSRYRVRPVRGGAGTSKLTDLSGLSVAIIEENRDNLDVFATFLRACGAHVVGAVRVDVVLQYVAVTAVDLIMTDVSVLPGGGAEFIDRVRSLPRHATTPVLAVTGWAEKDVRPAECGFTAFMQKPVDLDRLGAEIQRLARVEAQAARLASSAGA
jgi:CheY-like chemotaxis protein